MDNVGHSWWYVCHDQMRPWLSFSSSSEDMILELVEEDEALSMTCSGDSGRGWSERAEVGVSRVWSSCSTRCNGPLWTGLFVEVSFWYFYTWLLSSHKGEDCALCDEFIGLSGYVELHSTSEKWSCEGVVKVRETKDGLAIVLGEPWCGSCGECASSCSRHEVTLPWLCWSFSMFVKEVFRLSCFWSMLSSSNRTLLLK